MRQIARCVLGTNTNKENHTCLVKVKQPGAAASAVKSFISANIVEVWDVTAVNMTNAVIKTFTTAHAKSAARPEQKANIYKTSGCEIMKDRVWKIGDAVRCIETASDNYGGMNGIIADWGYNNTIGVRFPNGDHDSFFDDEFVPAHGCLRLTALWQPNGPSVGKKFRRAILGTFPNIPVAGLFLDVVKPAERWPYLFCYLLEPAPAYRVEYSYPVAIFDRHGVFRGTHDDCQTNCFRGREEQNCQFKRGDIVQFGDYKLTLGVVAALPPDPVFIEKIYDPNGAGDACDDSYLILYGKKETEHNHLHESCLFAPDADIPPAITALSKAVLSDA